MDTKRTIRLVAAVAVLAVPAAVVLAAEGPGEEPEMASRMALLVVQLSIVFMAAWGSGTLFEKMKMPGVLGEIFAGILIGPYLLGSIPLPGFAGGLFPLHGGFAISPELYGFTTLASIILLFVVGLETDTATFFRYAVAGSAVGLGGAVLSFVLGDLVAVYFSATVFGEPLGFAHPLPLFLGVIATATSVGLSARILSEKRKMDSPEGVTILAGAVVDDVLGIVLLAIVVGIGRSGAVDWPTVVRIGLRAVGVWLGFTVLGLVFAHQLGRFLKTFKSRRLIALMSFSLALLLAGIFEKSGLAMIIGAYVMGLSLSRTDLSLLIRDNLRVLQQFFVPIFFCAMGMLVNLRAISSLNLLLAGLVYAVVCILAKVVGCGLPALFFNFNLRGALRVGAGMAPRAEVALIITAIGLAAGILPQEAFGIAIIMTLVSMLVTPPLLAALLSSDQPALRRAPPKRAEYHDIVYRVPNPETLDFVVRKVIEAFENEGFFVNRLEWPAIIYQMRKDEALVSMQTREHELVFSCRAPDVSLVHTVFYEMAAELEHMMKSLQSLTDKEAIGKQIFADENGGDKAKANAVPEALNSSALTVDLQGETKQAIIKELVELLITSGQLDEAKRQRALDDLFEREASMSTGMQDGIALPHSRTAAVDHLLCAIGVKREGIDFDSLDEQPARIFIMTLSPKDHPGPYLQFMAELTKFLIREEDREGLLNCRTSDELHRLLTTR